MDVLASIPRRKSFALFVSAMCMLACEQTSQEKAAAESAIHISTGNEIVIGEVISMTGLEASFGISTRNGVNMAIDKVNHEGGIRNRKLRLELMDDKGKPEEAVLTITRMIEQFSPIAVIGGVASSRSIAMAPIAQSQKIPMISPSSTHPRVTEVGNYIFRVCFIDPFQGSVMAKFAREQLKAKKVSILRDLKNEYSLGLAQFFKEKFVELGGQIISIQPYNAGDTDFKSQLTAAMEGKPDLLYVPGYYTDVGFIIRQAREMGIQTTFAGGDGWDSEKLYQIGGKALEGSYFSNHYSPETDEPRLRSFVAAYKKIFKAIPDGQAALGYDAAMVLIEALKKAKALTSDDVRDAIAATKDFPGVTGIITLNPQRNAIKPAVILKVENGRARYVQTVGP